MALSATNGDDRWLSSILNRRGPSLGMRDFRGKIYDAADKEFDDFLVQPYGWIVIQDPFILWLDADVLGAEESPSYGSCFLKSILPCSMATMNMLFSSTRYMMLCSPI